MATDAVKISKIIKLLKREYPHAKIVLNYSTPWELLVSVILSAQCTDQVVNKVTEKLFAKYKTFDDYLHVESKEFEQDIKSTGFYHNKAKNILAAAKRIKEKFGGAVPDSMESLLTLPGVARKTANIVLGNAFGIIEGIAVDTHVHRLSQRLRLVNLDNIGGKKILYVPQSSATKTSSSASVPRIDYKKDADPNKIEKELMATVPASDWFHVPYLLQSHGRTVCRAQRPDCKNCKLSAFCAASRI